MLVLSRKEREVIQIGDDIKVTIVRIGRSVARIGIEAPQGIRVLRGELKRNLSCTDTARNEPTGIKAGETEMESES